MFSGLVKLAADTIVMPEKEIGGCYEKKSKVTILIIALLISLSVVGFAFASDFCDGFKQGYKTGYKQAKGTNLDPLVPLCPLQPLKKFGDPKSDFEHGYTIGFKKGIVDGSK